MRLWPWSKSHSKRNSRPVVILRAKYDAAQTTPDNRRHWANADYFSADAAASPAVRRILRARARYEVANNSYARGIVLTLANDVIGTGPRLQLLTEDPQLNSIIEAQFESWAAAIDLAGKLRTMRMARAQDGEAFALLFSNANALNAVKLDLRLIEADQVASPILRTRSGASRSNPQTPDARLVDGIVFDAYGNPVEYHVLAEHPGASTGLGPAGRDAYERVPAAYVLHWFRADRAGQSRGLPDILPALPLFAQLRRYTLAVIAAAESAANVAILMKTGAPAGGEAADVEPMTEMEFVPNMAVFTPEGWEPSQIKAEQPATTYEMFKREILNEIARCLNMPYNIAACNSSSYNYASGRLDHQTYYKSIAVEQADLATRVLDRVLAAWLEEAARVFGWGDVGVTDHQWFWDGHEHVDPAKAANAQATRLANHSTTLAAEYAKAGLDWESELRQRAREVTLMRELGLTATQAQPAPPADEDPDQTQKDDDDVGEDEDARQAA
jgi:lambda family phage portal protein